MKKLSVFLSVIVLLIIFCEDLCAQKYAKMRMSLNNGVQIDGKKGVLGRDKVSLSVSGMFRDYPLDEVTMIMAKKGKIGKYAAGFGGGCFAISMIAVIANPNDDDQGTLVAGALIWTALFTGIGAGIGAIADPWKTIYVRSQQSSIYNRLNLSFSSNRYAPYNIGVVYRFN